MKRTIPSCFLWKKSKNSIMLINLVCLSIKDSSIQRKGTHMKMMELKSKSLLINSSPKNHILYKQWSLTLQERTYNYNFSWIFPVEPFLSWAMNMFKLLTSISTHSQPHPLKDNFTSQLKENLSYILLMHQEIISLLPKPKSFHNLKSKHLWLLINCKVSVMWWDQDLKNKFWITLKKETYLTLKYSHLTLYCGCSKISLSSNKL